MGVLKMESWEELIPDEKDELASVFSGHLHDLMRRKDGVALPRTLLPMLPTIRRFKVREDDIFVVSFPKCGTTLTMELCWLVSHHADTATASASRGQRCAFLEGPGVIGSANWEEYYAKLDSAPSPRVFNSHLPLDLLPASLLTGRVVFVGRGVRDAAVSYYHHNRLLKAHNYTGDFPTFASLYRRALLPFGNYWAQLAAFWPLRSHPRVRITWYEQLVADRKGEIERIAAFLGKQITNEEVEKVSDFLQVDSYRAACQLGNRDNWNEGEGHFVRKGVVGDSVSYFDAQERKDWDRWAADNLAKLGIKEERVLKIFSDNV